jgi:hypothetical protein
MLLFLAAPVVVVVVVGVKGAVIGIVLYGTVRYWYTTTP